VELMTMGTDYAKLHMGRGMLNVDQRMTDFEGRLLGVEAGRSSSVALRTFTATEGQSVFVLVDTIDPEYVRVEVEGEEQDRDTNYTITLPSTITLSEGVPAGSEVKVWLYGSSVSPDGGLYVEQRFDRLETDLGDIATNVNDFNTLQDALASIGTQTKTLLIQKNITISANAAIPVNVNLWFAPQGKFTVNSGITLTINGAMTAGLWQVFDGLGTVNGSPRIIEAYPEWFGAKVNDTSVDNATLFDKTQKFFPKVKLGLGVYNFKTSLIPIYSATFEGSGRITDLGYNMTVLKQLSDLPTIQMGSSQATFRNLQITGDTTKPNNDGVLFPCLGSQTTIDQVLIRQCGGHGIQAKGSSSLGVDNCSIINVKVESCGGYGVKLNIDAANSSGFNTTVFQNVECTRNQLGGFYVDKAASLTFTRCHSFWNENTTTPQTIHDYTLKSNAQNLVFLNCWSESSGEHSSLDPLHKGAGFYIDGATDVKIISPVIVLQSRGIHIKTGRNIIVEAPTISLLNWMSQADLIIESGAQDVLVRDFDKDNPIIANFCNTAVIQFNKDMPTSGRFPLNGHYRRGVRGRAHSHKQGSYAQFEISASGCNGTAGDSFFTYLATSLRVGDNITLPLAGTSGGGLTCQITDIDVVLKRLYINTPIITTFSGQVPATLQAGIYSETYSSGTTAITNPQEGDTIYTIFPNAHGHSGWKCTVGGASPTWKTWGTLV
jgi:hypothetical protein